MKDGRRKRGMNRDLALKILALCSAVKDALDALLGSMFIIYQPKDVIIENVGVSIEFTFKAMNVSAYQWQYTTDGETWVNSAGIGNKTDTLKFTASITNIDYAWRCKLTDSDGNISYTDLCHIIIEGS